MEKPRAVAVIPFADQRPGTSGLRKTVAVFRQPGYIEAYVQATLDTMPKVRGATVVLGGDGRYFNDQALATLLRLLAANGVARAYVGAAGLLSTPAASLAIRKKHADFGFVLSASHNPGGPEGDFGLKLNLANGGPAPEGVTEAIFAKSKTITRFLTIAAEAPDLARPGRFDLAGMTVEVFDPVADYADLMERLFDFDRIRRLITSGLRLRFDAMHAITGPYAIEILERRLGASPGSVVNGAPLADFGGHHPDPNPAHAADLIAWAAAQEGAVFAAASDGDGDRHMIVGRDGPIAPSDSLAILAANAHLVPAFRDGLRGVARSMPTAPALDRVAAALGLPCFETPTGWKFFGTLLDAGKIRLCGEESAGLRA
ncbi:MAG: alpha-D-glucose phosphate-specific phosphoglucomutase, partial [Alphaproteobacteria bacterium]|nr:alpha-D-glucose phosphate-specific phosphoglucomutase [Alphaproteobacteria bacterium]